MVGRRLNKLIARCQLNWQIIDCVEELSVNFLTNTVQEEHIDTLIEEINKEYAPKFLTKRSGNNEVNEVHKFFEGVKTRLNEIKNFKMTINESIAQIESLKETNQQNQLLEQLKTEFNKFEYDIVEDERNCEFLELNEEEGEEFNSIMEERREFLSRLEVAIENIKL
jgi:Rad3-related DNA helicase